MCVKSGKHTTGIPCFIVACVPYTEGKNPFSSFDFWVVGWGGGENWQMRRMINI
jgi:hypothetical protein